MFVQYKYNVCIFCFLKKKAYEQCWCRLVDYYKPNVFGFFFLDLSSEECLERLKKRARDNEASTIRLEYLNRIQEAHRALYFELSKKYATCSISNV